MIYLIQEGDPVRIGLSIYKDVHKSIGFKLRLSKWFIYYFRYSVPTKKVFHGRVFKNKAAYLENQANIELLKWFDSEHDKIKARGK